MSRKREGKPVLGDRSDDPRAILTQLAKELRQPGKAAIAGLADRWQRFGMDQLSLTRNTLVDSLNPQTLVARSGIIEDPSQRAAPERATLYMDVTVDDRDYFSTARSSSWMSLVLMLGVLGFLVGWHIVKSSLTPAPVTEFPLLRVPFRWQDRPGALHKVLDAISKVLVDELPSFQEKDWSVSYVRLQVLTGEVALGQLTIRMHIPEHAVAGWSLSKMEAMGRKIEAAAAGESADSPGGDPGNSVDPLVSVFLIKKPQPEGIPFS